MRRLVALSLALVLAVAGTTRAAAGGDSPVQYTFTFTDLGQPGAHGGGPLYADGSAAVTMTLVAAGGQAIVRLEATRWSEVVAGELIDICFATFQLKGPPILPPAFCFSQVLGMPLPVNGTPIVFSNPFGALALIRVTPAQ